LLKKKKHLNDPAVFNAETPMGHQDPSLGDLRT